MTIVYLYALELAVSAVQGVQFHQKITALETQHWLHSNYCTQQDAGFGEKTSREQSNGQLAAT